MRFHPFRRSVLPALIVCTLAACNEEPDFGLGDWEAEFDTVTLYSADRAEHQGLPAAYDILATRTLRVEDAGSTGSWDFALTGAGGGALALIPIGAFFGVESNAGLAVVSDRTFDELESAPSANSAYTTDEAITLQAGVVYVVRSRVAGSCRSFAKLEPIEIDQADGTFTFQLSANPNCNDTALVPPED